MKMGGLLWPQQRSANAFCCNQQDLSSSWPLALAEPLPSPRIMKCFLQLVMALQNARDDPNTVRSALTATPPPPAHKKCSASACNHSAQVTLLHLQSRSGKAPLSTSAVACSLHLAGSTQQ